MTPTVWFNILVGLGIAVAAAVVDRLNRAVRTETALRSRADEAVLVMVAAGAAAFVGSIAFSAMAEGRTPFSAPWSFTFLGGVVGGLGGFAVAARVLRVPMRSLADHMAIGVAAGHAIGRLGCLVAGCCHGVACKDSSLFSWLAPEVAHVPVQLLESLAEAANLAVLAWILHRARLPRGSIALGWMALYGAERFLLEFLRGDDRGSLVPAESLGLSPSQGVSLLLMGIAIVGLPLLRRRSPPPSA